jgi:hypothetical protein
MRHSASFHPSSLDIRVIWANMHRWNAGSEYAQPMVCHALWLVQKGDVEISDDEQSWTVSAGDMLLWPHNNFRRIKALCNSQWLSLGLSVWALGHLDVLNWLGLPRVWRPTPQEYDLLQNWINQIIAEVRVPRAIASNEFFTSVDAEHISEYSHQSNHAACLRNAFIARRTGARDCRALLESFVRSRPGDSSGHARTFVDTRHSGKNA